MKTISFRIQEDSELEKILSILEIFGAEDIRSSNTLDDEETLPQYVVEDIKEGIQELEDGQGIPSHLVHKEALELCMK